jgi:hypothetical protein
LWFDSKNHNEPFYIGRATALVDKRLLAITPPCSLSRTPRSLACLKFWKAHEWLAWLLYYSLIVLKDILPSAYYNHWAIMVDSVAILLSTDISLSQVVCCERNFKSFVAGCEQLYGKQHVSFNVHLTLHLVQSVRDFGPLWAHSAFMFESFNAVLLNMIKDTQGVPMQILQTFCQSRAIPFNVKSVLARCSPPQQMFIESLTMRKRHVASAVAMESLVTLLGTPKYRKLSRAHYVALHSVNATVTWTVVAYYARAVIRGELLHSKCYTKAHKRNSYTVQLTNGTFFQIVTFVVADMGFGQNCYAIGRILFPASFNLSNNTDMSLKLGHIASVRKVPSSLVAADVAEIACKCVFVCSVNCDVNFVCNQVHLLDCCA